MTKLYFTGKYKDDIISTVPIRNGFAINPDLYEEVRHNYKQNTRVFLDTKLLKLRNSEGIVEEPSTERLIYRSKASFGLSVMEGSGAVVYVTEALMKAEFNEISSKEFEDSFLAPLDKAIQTKEMTCKPLQEEYKYLLDDSNNSELEIQTYFTGNLAIPFGNIYCDLCGRQSKFGPPPRFRPPLYRHTSIQPDIAHLYSYTAARDFNSPEYCFALGDYKKGNYRLGEGFENLIKVIRDYNLKGQRQFILEEKDRLFRYKQWSSDVVFALVLRKYLLDAFLCGTDRVFISDHQSFSGFFQYEFICDQMKINYYVINDPETVADGITLRAAMAGFFYRDLADAAAIKEKLAPYCELAKKVTGDDPFGNVTPKNPLQGSKNYKKTLETLPDVEDNSKGKVEEVIEGNTIGRVIYDAPECYPGLGIHLPSKVFVKLYHFSSRSWEMHELMCFGIPTKEEYYDMFYNELLINEKISKSQYASNFPKLFTSGYWNGLHDHLMHIFEYLGKGLPMESWDIDKVYKVIKTRIKELHDLGITHNDISESNIHVSVEGKVSLIDFGLSDSENNGKRKQKDFDDLDEIFQKGRYNTMDQNKENIDVGPVYEYKINDEELGDKKVNGDNSKTGPEVQKNASNFLNK